MRRNKNRVAVVESENDMLENPENNSAIEKRNRELQENFISYLDESNHVQSEGICSFQQLRSKYKFL